MIGKYVFYSLDKQKILYKVIDETNDEYTICGVYYRVLKTCLKTDVYEASSSDVDAARRDNDITLKRVSSLNIRNKKFLCGKVLHIDGDNEYLNRCQELYEKVGVYSYGIMIDEKEIASRIEKYIIELDPDVVVITGHDSYNNQGLKDLNNYTNTKYFCEAIRKIRKIRSKNDVCVIAGACQSNFEALIASGANYASSPKRINIHTYDPAIIAIKVATTDFKKSVSMINVNQYIENGLDAFSGIDSLGKMRMVL